MPVVVRFPDLEQFVLQQNVSTMDLGDIGDEGAFTLVLFDRDDNAELVRIDPVRGMIGERIDIEFAPSAATDDSANGPPENKFH